MDKEQKEHKRAFEHIILGFGQMRAVRNKFESDKDKGDSVGWRKAFIVYSWIWAWQVFTKIGFGKIRKKDVYEQIEQDLMEPKPHVVVGALIRAGLVEWGRGEYEGKMNYCLQCTYLNKKIRNSDTNTEQTETQVVQLESSVKGSAENGEYYEFGKRFYRDNNGDSHIVPHDAPQRPNNTAFWDGKQWRESKPDSNEHKEKLRHSYGSWEMPEIEILGNGLIRVYHHTLSDRNGEYWDFAFCKRRYIPNPEYAMFCSCDVDAPPRPTPTALWYEHEWIEPENIP